MIFKHVELRKQPCWRRAFVRLFGVRAFNYGGSTMYYEWRGRCYWCLA